MSTVGPAWVEAGPTAVLTLTLTLSLSVAAGKLVG